MYELLPSAIHVPGEIMVPFSSVKLSTHVPSELNRILVSKPDEELYLHTPIIGSCARICQVAVGAAVSVYLELVHPDKTTIATSRAKQKTVAPFCRVEPTIF